MSSDADIGTDLWGIALDKSELESLDIEGRGSFANEISVELMPTARALPTFGGAYFDQRENGNLVILLTSRDATVEDGLRRLAPAGARSVEFQYVAHSEAQLIDAMKAIWDVWPDTFLGIELLSASVDSRNNRLHVEVLEASWTLVRRDAATLEAQVGRTR